MEFSPNNPVVRLCLQGMALEEKDGPDQAIRVFRQAWSEAIEDLEKFIAAYHVARIQQDAAEKLRWLETALHLALKINDDSVKPALPVLYSEMGKCYELLNSADKAVNFHGLAASTHVDPSDTSPFYHGTKADLPIGALLTAGGMSNYQSELQMNHIYFTALVNGAGLAAALARGDGRQRIYIVEPMGSFENDPNVTNKKFPGNPTRSYRSKDPLKIVGEVTDWKQQTPDQLQQWRQKLANNSGEIIN